MGKNGHRVNNTKDFVDRSQTRTIDDDEEQVSYDVSNLFGNIKTDRALEVTKQRLMNDNPLKIELICLLSK